MGKDNLNVILQPYYDKGESVEYDLDRILFGLDSQIELLSSRADKLDYLVSIASGLLCGLLDILWVGEFQLERGRSFASDEVDEFVQKIAKLLGHKKDDLQSAVQFLEDRFHIPSDGNTPEFGGGLQHHLRDFAHHPTIAGLIFSLMTQFTGKSYGTDVNGTFIVCDVSESSKAFIGKDVSTKVLFGTFHWFLHLVSDMAGSRSTAGRSGGTGIPGPLLALAKEMSSLPLFGNMKYGDKTLSLFLSKLFNGTLLAKRGEDDKIIKGSELRFDLRGELGVGFELGRQSIPVVANECITRSFYFFRQLAIEVKENEIQSINELRRISWSAVSPRNTPTIARMLTIASGVFTAVDIGESIATQKYWLSINYIGVGRFAIAIEEDISWCLKARDVKKIKRMYEDIQRNTFEKADRNIFERIGEDMDMEKLGLTTDQTMILYNLEYYKTLNDVQSSKLPLKNDGLALLKLSWLHEWKSYITKGFPAFLGVEDAEMQWFTEEELVQKVEENNPENTWFRLVLLETMLFEPYYPLGVEKDKKGHPIPSRKYKDLQNIITRFSKGKGDKYLDSLFTGSYYPNGFVKRLRKSYDKTLRELSEVLKMVVASVTITAVITIVIVASAGMFAPHIAVALVGSKFAGLSGAALVSASLAYLGGGAVAAGGAGMAGGIAAIVGGGAILGVGVGAGIGGAAGASSVLGKKNTILQSAKLLVSVKEIFLNDEHDTVYSNAVYEKYVQNIVDIEKGIAELRVRASVATGSEKKELISKIKKAQESAEVMTIAMKNLRRFMSSFEEGLANE